MRWRVASSAVALPDGRVLLSFRFNLDGEQVGFAIGETFRGPFRSVSNLSHAGGNDEDSYLWRQPDGTLHARRVGCGRVDDARD